VNQAPLKIDDLPELDLKAYEKDPVGTLDALRPNRLVRSTRGVEIISCPLGYELLADQRLQPLRAEDFSAHGATDYIAEFVDKGVFLHMPPERHRQIRKFFQRGFGGKTLLAAKDAIAETAGELADDIAARGEAELIEDFTLRLSIRSLCKLVGYPAQEIDEIAHAALDLRKLVYVPMKPHVADIEAALKLLHDYAVKLLDERRRNPQEDFLSALIEEEKTAQRMTNDEVVWGTVNLLLGGIDTTNFQMGSTLMHLIQQGLWDKVGSDPELRDVVIEESMRMTPVATMLGRVVHEALEIDGVAIPVGTSVKINMVAAGRDPAQFDSPHQFRLDRKPPSFPMMFGNGVHMCIGKNLAWHELRSGVDVLTSRITDIEFTTELPMSTWTEAFYGPKSLPVRLRAR